MLIENEHYKPDVAEADNRNQQKLGAVSFEIGYFVCSNIQHLPPVIQLYPRLGGVLITTKKNIRDFVQNKYADLDIPVVCCADIGEARTEARRLRLRMVIHTSFHLLYCGKAVQIFHGGLSDKRYLESARLISYDLVLFPGRKSVDKVKLATTLPWIRQWRLVGYPKFDPYLNGDLTTVELFKKPRRTVLYAPTWVSEVTSMKPGERSKYGESSLRKWCLEIVQQLAGDFNVIVKFHSRMLSGKIDVYDRLNSLIEENNWQDVVKAVVDDNILPYMECSDLMISDMSSACYEWLHFDRPLLFANPAPGKYKIGSKVTDNTYVWQCGEVIDRTEDIKRLVNREIENDTKSEIRNRIFRYAIFQPDGQAGRRQAEYILELYDEIKLQNWWLLYLKSALVLRWKRTLANIFRYTRDIPR